jgi:hypothetical protein
MARRFQFSTRRLLLATAVVAVWSAVLLNAYRFLPSANLDSPLFMSAAIVCFFALPILFLMWLAAVFIKALAKKSNLLACGGTAAFVAFVAFLSWAEWF